MNQSDRTVCTFPVADFDKLKSKMLNWANRFSIFCFLDNSQYAIQPQTHECLLAAESVSSFEADAGNALSGLKNWMQHNKGWKFGHFGYDLKNEIESLSSNNKDRIEFPDLFFFKPQTVIQLNEKEITIESSLDPTFILKKILAEEIPVNFKNTEIEIQGRIQKEAYIDIIKKLKNHILRGDCYEINFCMEFFAENVALNPIHTYSLLSKYSPNPFSALYKLKDKFLVCASPERYLKKDGNKILSQPIKGTSLRVLTNEEEDAISKNNLYNSQKEKAENVMVVDLVRNDLSKICEAGTVQVNELFGIYSFPQVHQMISTISGSLKKGIHFTEIIKATFPMGSMTGVPKIKVMELIEEYEKTKRGIFSGSVGYINPNEDFDFNVVIRSIMYNQSSKYLSYQVGSGITHHCNPESEWEECLLKALAIKKALTDSSTLL